MVQSTKTHHQKHIQVTPTIWAPWISHVSRSNKNPPKSGTTPRCTARAKEGTNAMASDWAGATCVSDVPRWLEVRQKVRWIFFLSGLISWECKGTPPKPPPPSRNKALIRPY